jgi:protein-disulfide isomerase
MTHNGSPGTTRRRVLLGVGAGATVALAGCTSGGEGGADNVPVRGNPDANVTLEVYEDLGCPACQSYIQNGFDSIQTNYLEDGLVRYEHRDFITTGIAAEQAASAAREVLERHGDEDFWAFVHAIYDNQNRLRAEVPSLFGEIAGNLGLDADAIEAAGENRDHQNAVQADIDRGRNLGVQGTPSFVVDGNLVDRSGAATMNQLVAAVSQQLDQALDG